MVSLLVASRADAASIGPFSALLALGPSIWRSVPSMQNLPSYAAGRVRMLQLAGHMLAEDHLDKRWEDETGEHVEEIIFLSKHTANSNRPALTLHPIGLPHLRADEKPVAGGRPGWAAPPCPRLGPWFRLMKDVAAEQQLVPEFEITMEATHHGPEVNAPAMFVEIGSTEEYWARQDAAQAIATIVWKGLGLDGGPGVGNWTEAQRGEQVIVGIGGGHYVPRHLDIVKKEGVWVGHLLSGYSIPMEENGDGAKPGLPDYSHIGGTWKEAIRTAIKTTEAGFPGGKVVVHIDSKSFKSWQRSAISWFLAQEQVAQVKVQDFTTKK